jgi:hypothetical protein
LRIRVSFSRHDRRSRRGSFAKSDAARQTLQVENPCAWNETLEFQGLLIAIDFM